MFLCLFVIVWHLFDMCSLICWSCFRHMLRYGFSIFTSSDFLLTLFCLVISGRFRATWGSSNVNWHFLVDPGSIQESSGTIFERAWESLEYSETPTCHARANWGGIGPRVELHAHPRSETASYAHKWKTRLFIVGARTSVNPSPSGGPCF